MKDPAVRGLVFAWFAIQSAAISNSSLVTVCGLMSLELPLVANGNIAERTVELLFIDVALANGCSLGLPPSRAFKSKGAMFRCLAVGGSLAFPFSSDFSATLKRCSSECFQMFRCELRILRTIEIDTLSEGVVRAGSGPLKL